MLEEYFIRTLTRPFTTYFTEHTEYSNYHNKSTTHVTTDHPVSFEEGSGDLPAIITFSYI